MILSFKLILIIEMFKFEVIKEKFDQNFKHEQKKLKKFHIKNKMNYFQIRS